MKKVKLTLIVATVLMAAVLFIDFSCTKDDCNGEGTLSLTNKSSNTVQRIMINGVNYGTIDPGDKKDIKLVPGVYSWQLVGLYGGTGCSGAEVTITACVTQGFSCNGK